MAAFARVETVRKPLEAPVIVHPLEQSKWDEQLARHPDATLFHGTAWARVLCETYGHKPVYFCRFADGELKQLLAVMEVSSRLRGRRGVSLPFSDFCAPLSTDGEDLGALYDFAVEHGRERKWKYFETRGRFDQWQGAMPSLESFGHTLPLEGGEEALFKGLNSAVRRGISKAEEAKIKIEFGNTIEFAQVYYELHCRSRKRSGLPPQPVEFFENIARHVFGSGHGFVAVARYEGRPVAAGVFFHEGNSALYKFGAGDHDFQQMRPSHLLMWEAIKHCAVGGFAELHFGCTSLLNDGVRHFNLGFGAREERVEYARYDLRRSAFVKNADRPDNRLNNAFRCLPLPLLRLAGRFSATF